MYPAYLLTDLASYVDLIISVIGPIMNDQASTVEVKASSEKVFHDTLHLAMDRTVFNSSCSSVRYF